MVLGAGGSVLCGPLARRRSEECCHQHCHRPGGGGRCAGLNMQTCAGCDWLCLQLACMRCRASGVQAGCLSISPRQNMHAGLVPAAGPLLFHSVPIAPHSLLCKARSDTPRIHGNSNMHMFTARPKGMPLKAPRVGVAWPAQHALDEPATVAGPHRHQYIMQRDELVARYIRSSGLHSRGTPLFRARC